MLILDNMTIRFYTNLWHRIQFEYCNLSIESAIVYDKAEPQG